MRVSSLKTWAILIVTLLLQPVLAVATAETPPPVQTLCILNFNRLGDDASTDWLQRGLADMMISSMNRLSPFQVIERAHLRDLLREHGLATSGLLDTDTDTAIQQARLAKAQLLLLGSFARQQDQLTIQVRLLRISDQQILAQSAWIGRHTNVLGAPQTLSENILAHLGKPVDPAQFTGIETDIPTAIDVAKAYYTGIAAFDDGHYPEALAHYLDAARQAGDFSKAYPAVIDLYELLGQSEHAVVFARNLAQFYAAQGDVPNALAYYFAAAEQCLGPLSHPRLATVLLETLLRLVAQHEQQTQAMTRTRQAILDKIEQLHATGTYASFGKILAHPSIRYRMWPADIDAELRRRAETQARGGYTVLQDNKWVKRPVPRPSVLMWKIRAHRTLARAYTRLGQIKAALTHYQHLLVATNFLTRHPLYDGRQPDAIRTEAHFMMLHHYAKTGHLIRDHALNRLNRLNGVTDGLVVKRDFGDRSPDPRARTASRYADRGYEYFDFAAPPGHQIDSLTLRVKVKGIAAFSFNLPHPVGWPPRFSFSKRLKNFKFSKPGTYAKTVVLPPGTEFVSTGTSWGPGLFSNTPAEVRYRLRFGPQDGIDIESWEVSFTVSANTGAIAKTTPDDAAPLGAAMQELVTRYTARWDGAVVVRPPQTVVYTGDPALDVYAEDWLVVAMDGDIRLVRRNDPQFTIDLPLTINSRQQEFDPSLVRTHDSRYALLWARGTSKTNARRFVAFSEDLLRWETPQRMAFEAPIGKIGYTYGRLEPPERTYNVVPIRQGYAMLLAQGFMRYSDDLRHWGRPQKVMPHDMYRNRLLKTRDGTVWAVYENASDTLQPYTSADWRHGYFVVNGKRYRHVTELRVSRSVDGVDWQASGKLTFPGQPSALWSFPVSDRHIGIAVAFNNRFVQWLTASRPDDLRRIDSDLQVMHDAAHAECFVRDASLICVRPVFDVEAQKPILLATSSQTLYQRLTE